MKKIFVLAFLPALLLSACNTDNGVGINNGYGSDGFAEESLSGVASSESFNDAYLLAAAPKYYLGGSYKVEDVQYTPVEDLAYNQTGIAGIIPAELNGVKTSNGETFDVNQMVATSKTLPLPTIARVTNLDNGQSVVVRVNNRGPFVNTRLMDLSPAAARKIGINGQSKVQVQVLSEQSTQVKNATLGSAVAVAETYNPAPVVTPVATTGENVGTGEYSIQLGAFYSEDSALALSQRLGGYGNATIVNEAGMYKVRLIGLDASSARSAIDRLRSNEGMAPGLLKNGRWVNADSI